MITRYSDILCFCFGTKRKKRYFLERHEKKDGLVIVVAMFNVVAMVTVVAAIVTAMKIAMRNDMK